MTNAKLTRFVLYLFIHEIVVAGYINSLCAKKTTQVKLTDALDTLNVNVKQLFNDSTRKLGSGSYGLVKSSPWIDGSTVAIKRIVFNRNDPDDIEALEKELETMITLTNYSFVPKLIGCTLGINVIYLVQELIQGYTLDKQDFSDMFKFAKPHIALSYMIQMFEGVYHMSQEDLVHNDIKPSNMMFDSIYRKIYLIDFGTAEKTTNVKLTIKGTPYFISLNRLKKGPYRPLDDLFSLVISIASLYSGVTKVYTSCLLYKGVEANAQQLLSNRLFDLKCQQVFRSNLIEIFARVPYLNNKGPYYDPSHMTLTQLFIEIATNPKFDLSMDTVMNIIYQNAEYYGVRRSSDIQPVELPPIQNYNGGGYAFNQNKVSAPKAEFLGLQKLPAGRNIDIDSEPKVPIFPNINSEHKLPIIASKGNAGKFLGVATPNIAGKKDKVNELFYSPGQNYQKSPFGFNAGAIQGQVRDDMLPKLNPQEPIFTPENKPKSYAAIFQKQRSEFLNQEPNTRIQFGQDNQSAKKTPARRRILINVAQDNIVGNPQAYPFIHQKGGFNAQI